MRVARSEELELSFRHALRRVDTCGGNPEDAIRRMRAGGVEARAGVCELLEHAAHQGIVLTPRSVHALIKKHGRAGTREYLDKLEEILDAASVFGVDCTQGSARWRLAHAGGDARCVITKFAAVWRRREDRRTAKCRVPVPPRALVARANALAGCGCPHCCNRLATQLQPYIGKVIAAAYFSGLDREEVRAEAYEVLIKSVEAWRGGENFAGYFARCLKSRIGDIYRARSPAERGLVSLDAPAVLSDDQGGRIVALCELVSDRTTDVITIVIRREELAENELELRRQLIARAKEYDEGTQRRGARSAGAGLELAQVSGRL